MAKLKELKLKKFIEIVKAEVSEVSEDNLKSFYEQNKEREVNIATRLAINQFKTMVSSEYLVLGYNLTKYKKPLLVAYNQQKKEFKSIGGAISDIITNGKPLDKITVKGTDTTGILYATSINKTGQGDLQSRDISYNLSQLKKGDKIILGHRGNITVFYATDWEKYEKGTRIADSEKLPIFSNGVLNFAISFWENENKIYINFRSVPLRFFSDMLIPSDLENIEALQTILNMVPFVIPIYINDEPKDEPSADGRIITRIKAVGFGIIPLKTEQENGNIVIIEEEEKKEPSGENKDTPEISKENDITNLALKILNKYDTLSLEAFKKELNMTEDATFNELIENLCKKGFALLPDPDTIKAIEKKTENNKWW